MELSSISEFGFETEEFLKRFTQLKNLKTTGCEELTSLWKSRNRWLQHHIGNSQSHFVQELVSLQQLHIIGCSTLISFPEVDLPPFLKHLKIESCSSLVYFTRSHMPLTLRRIEIGDCLELKSLVEGEASSSSSSSCLMNEEASSLEYLKIWKCPSLTSLLDRSQLPRALEQLFLWDCEQLESITDKFQDKTCLECVDIRRCPNLKSLPERMCYLTNLQKLYIFQCGSLVSFPRGQIQPPT
ncbi:putative leucine-rich repeat domain, L domain-containing protein [Rosa chinensis]|uniref:Putative leucine-rich repeat domain, L domain-containing protein n=1 Tax=Rosa chinensis TaxID=74649 RepID=A0A2P6S8N7_ROSCH|nr:putative leucine-rich repeat domain, L domain-containing protein [Rosa chinensis]